MTTELAQLVLMIVLMLTAGVAPGQSMRTSLFPQTKSVSAAKAAPQVAADKTKSVASAEADVRKVLDEFLAGADSGDPRLYDGFWADDLVYTGSSGKFTNKKEMMKGLKAPGEHDPVEKFHAEDVTIHMYNQNTMAVVAFKLVQDVDDHGVKTTNFYRNTGTFLLRKGKWQPVAWQATKVPPATTTK